MTSSIKRFKPFTILRIALILIIALPLQGQLKVPEWAKDAVWYQIFPERFRNGDPSNDPVPSDFNFPANLPWQISPWTSDWYKLQPWEANRGGFYDVVFDRRYGGDLQGVIDKLDYIKDLGATAIYFNPIFDAPSLHKYDASTYHHIDKTFGPNRNGDTRLMESTETDDPATWRWTAADSLFLKLVEEAHVHGLKVIIDGVFNHSGTQFFAFKDVAKNQKASRYADWFDVRSWDNPATPQSEFDYKGWWDYKGHPEFKEDANGFITPVREYFFNITRRWMDPNGDGDPSDGIDGWRLDVANDVSKVFWREWRALVKSINPDAYIVGEIWDNAEEWLQGDMFDAVMNYPFARACVAFFVNTGTDRISVSQFDKRLKEIRESYPSEANYVLQNLFDSHDTDRLPSMILNPNRRFDDQNGLRNNKNYNVSKPTVAARNIQKLMAAFQMAYVGSPMVYYGTEAGMWGADDPDDRKPMVWPEFQYEIETAHPYGAERKPDTVAFDADMHAWYRTLMRLRVELEPLRRGDYRTLVTDDAAGVYIFSRTSPSGSVIVALNNSTAKTPAQVPSANRLKDLLTGMVLTPKNGKAEVILPPYGVALLRQE